MDVGSVAVADAETATARAVSLLAQMGCNYVALTFVCQLLACLQAILIGSWLRCYRAVELELLQERGERQTPPRIMIALCASRTPRTQFSQGAAGVLDVLCVLLR